MSSHRFATSLFVALTLVAAVAPEGAFAATRRRSAKPPAAQQPTGNDCHTFALVRSGLSASYQTTAPSGNVTYTINYISDTPTQTHTTQHVVTPQATTDVDTILDGEVVGLLRALRHIKITGSTAVPVIGTVSTTVNVDFVPSLVAGPAGGWCTGATWSVPATTETLTTTLPIGPPSSQIVTTIASQGEVLAVGESITVPAGTFRTVKYKSNTVSSSTVSPSITWQGMDNSIVIRQDTLDAGGAVTSTTVLTSVN